jgi:hypothetical protein
VSHHSYIEEEQHQTKQTERSRNFKSEGDPTVSPSRQRGCFAREPQSAVDVVSKVFRASLRAVDLVLHDYAAGNPDVLRQTISQAAAPNGVLVNRTQEYGASLDHQDIMETILAAMDPVLDQRIKTYIASTVPSTSKQSQQQAAVKFSLVGWLPASADLPVLGGGPLTTDGGLTVKQRVWVVRRMLEYFKREWFLARVGMQTVPLATTVPSGSSLREGFFDCFPRAL